MKATRKLVLITLAVFVVVRIAFQNTGIPLPGGGGSVFYERLRKPMEPFPQPIRINDNMTFAEAVSSLDWSLYGGLVAKVTPSTKNNLADDLKDRIVAFAQQVFLLAVEYAKLEPKTPINHSCQPPPLRVPSQTDCSESVSNAFNGKVHPRPRRVGHAVQFGFDVDNLEILLRELDDVIDVFFLVEWTFPHNQRLNPKPLLWEAVKRQPRFAFVAHKVVHIVMDDVDVAHVDHTFQWSAEHMQEAKRWQKIDEWNKQTGFFSDDDIIGFGDADEIPSRKNVHLLKYCRWRRPSPVDVGIWFPYGRINQAFRTDHPVRSFKYTLGDPTFHVFKRARSMYDRRKEVPSRNRGHSPYGILGGAHFTHYGYLVYQVLKRMTCTECDKLPYLIDTLGHLRAAVDSGKWHELEAWISRVSGERFVPLDQLDKKEREDVVYLPWFYDCNRDRYPMWEERPDSRTARLTSL